MVERSNVPTAMTGAPLSDRSTVAVSGAAAAALEAKTTISTPVIILALGSKLFFEDSLGSFRPLQVNKDTDTTSSFAFETGVWAS